MSSGLSPGLFRFEDGGTSSCTSSQGPSQLPMYTSVAVVRNIIQLNLREVIKKI